MDILAMLKIVINTISATVFTNIGFVVFLFIIYMQYKKNVQLQEIVYGKPKTSLNSLVLTSVLSGMVGGIVISIPMVIGGISFSQDMGMTILYLIIISIVLMMIEPRFVCFSYSGGILASVSLIFGLGKIDVTGILMLVALLHLLEAILIYMDGYRGAIPVFLQREDGSVSGGFSMQRFWPIPIALILFAGYGTSTGDVVSTPDWWPIIRPYIEPARLKEALFTAVPVAAILGYSEFTSSYMPKEKCKSSALKLSLFSIILLLLVIGSSYVHALIYLAAIFAPVGHELFIWYEKRLERSRPSLFSYEDKGLKVLDTMPDGAGEKMGIQPGDTVIAINNREISSEDGLNKFFDNYVNYIWVDVKNRLGEIRTIEFKDYKNGVDSLDVIIVPDNKDNLITVKEQSGYIKRLFSKITKISK